MERPTVQAAKPPQRRQSPANTPDPATTAQSAPRDSSNASSHTLQPSKSPESAIRRKRSSKSASPNPEQPLQKLRQDIDHLRELVTCNICYDLLFEPYTTSCGHTYCYGCLCHTFAQHRHAQCPQCRTRLRQAPAPAYLVRDMTHYFLKSPDLLAAGDSLTELQDRQTKASQEILLDKANKDRKTGGLFKGKFRKAHRRLRPIIDAEDGVSRCPYCQWELEDGMCNHCHLPFDAGGAGDWSSQWTTSSAASEMGGNLEDGTAYLSDGSDLSGSELSDVSGMHLEVQDPRDYMTFNQNEPWYDDESAFSRADSEDSTAVRDRARRALHSAANGRRHSYASSLLSDARSSEVGTIEEEDEEDDERDEDGDSEMQDFINDSDEDAASEASSNFESGDSQDLTAYHLPPSPPSVSVVNVHGSHNSSRPTIPTVLGRRRRPAWSSEEPTPEPTSIPDRAMQAADDDDEDDEGPVAPSQRRRNQRAVTTDDEDGPVAPIQRRQNQMHGQGHSVRSTPASVPSRGTSAQSPGPDSVDQSPSTGYSSRQGSESIGGSDTGNGVHLGFSSLDENDDAAEDGDSDATIDGLAHNPNSQRLSNEPSLTTSLDRIRTTSRSTLRRPSNTGTSSGHGLQRRTSNVARLSIMPQNESDADDEYHVGAETSATITPVVQRRPSVIHIGRVQPPNRPNAPGPERHTLHQLENPDSDSDGSGTSDTRMRSRPQRLRQPLHRTSIASLFNAHAHRQGVDPLPEIHSVAPELRGLSWTPLSRPRTANRNRLQNQPSSNRLSTIESVNGSISSPPSERLRSVLSVAPSQVNSRAPILSPRRSNVSRVPNTGVHMQTAINETSRSDFADLDSNGVNRLLQPATAAHIQRTAGNGLQRQTSRPSVRSQHTARPAVLGGSSNYPFQSSTVGINAAYGRQSMNPFRNSNSFIQAINPYFNPSIEMDRRPAHQISPPTAGGVRARPSAQRMRSQPSATALQSRPSSNRMRATSEEAEARVVSVTARQPQVQPSRINLRSQGLIQEPSTMTSVSQTSPQRERTRGQPVEPSAQVTRLIANRQQALLDQRQGATTRGQVLPRSGAPQLSAGSRIISVPLNAANLSESMPLSTRIETASGNVATGRRDDTISGPLASDTVQAGRQRPTRPAEVNRPSVNYQARSTNMPAAARA